jgi:hypothetical protein
VPPSGEQLIAFAHDFDAELGQLSKQRDSGDSVARSIRRSHPAAIVVHAPNMSIGVPPGNLCVDLRKRRALFTELSPELHCRAGAENP